MCVPVHGNIWWCAPYGGARFLDLNERVIVIHMNTSLWVFFVGIFLFAFVLCVSVCMRKSGTIHHNTLFHLSVRIKSEKFFFIYICWIWMGISFSVRHVFEDRFVPEINAMSNTCFVLFFPILPRARIMAWPLCFTCVWRFLEWLCLANQLTVLSGGC